MSNTKPDPAAELRKLLGHLTGVRVVNSTDWLGGLVEHINASLEALEDPRRVAWDAAEDCVAILENGGHMDATHAAGG